MRTQREFVRDYLRQDTPLRRFVSFYGISFWVSLDLPADEASMRVGAEKREIAMWQNEDEEEKGREQR